MPPVVPANIPAAAIQAAILAPVRRADLPDIVPGEGAEANGAPVADPREEARRVVQAEKVKVLRHQELLLERREQEEIRCDPELDYSFLQICRQGTPNLTKIDNILITHSSQDRGSARTSSPPAHTVVQSLQDLRSA